MEIDLNAVRARFAALTRDELLEEAALRVEDFTPPAQRILAEEARARGITAAQIEARRGAAAPAPEADGLEMPALLTSSDAKDHVRELLELLRERGIPGVVRELDPKDFHASGHRVGRWGLMVPGRKAAAAAQLLAATIPPPESAGAAGCGGGCCGAGAACDPSAEEWPEDGDWWQTVPGEDEPQGDQR